MINSIHLFKAQHQDTLLKKLGQINCMNISRYYLSFGMSYKIIDGQPWSRKTLYTGGKI